MDAWRQYLYRIVVTLLTEARATAAAARMRRNTLNYNDLMFKSAKLLRERADVRTALQAKHRWLFVDEFQDTDPVQAEIVFLLAAEEPEASVVSRREHAPLDWRSVALRPGALFVVGDPKQSIYRFRRADIEIYNLVRTRIAESANGACHPADNEFPIHARALRLGQRRVQGTVSASGDARSRRSMRRSNLRPGARGHHPS